MLGGGAEGKRETDLVKNSYVYTSNCGIGLIKSVVKYQGKV